MKELNGTTNSEGSRTALEDLLGYRFRDSSLLVRALTHRSYVNEHEGGASEHNESLEFLGDAVLGFLVSARLFSCYPDLKEGELSKLKAYLVSAVNLLGCAERIGLGEFLRLSRGEEKTGGRQKRAILVDGYEAVIGAIYLDGGVEAAAGFVEQQMAGLFEGLDLEARSYGDYKSALQEHLHDIGCPEPIYRVVDEIGPDHKKVFVVEVVIQGHVVAQASGRSKKEAQQAGARRALETLRREGTKPCKD